MNSSCIVEMEQVVKAYGSQVVLDHVSFQVKEGEMVALVGRSGSGKSTLLHVIGGIDREYQGLVRTCGKELASLSEKALSQFRNEEIGFVFQAFHLLEHMSCLENVMIPNAFAKRPLSEYEAKKRADLLLQTVGLADLGSVRPMELSGGQKQRVAIARALFHSPRLLLCDEPTGNLDSTTAAQVIDLFQQINQTGVTCVMVTHDANVSDRVDRVHSMVDGRIEK